jgi:hypothetical protein
MKLIIVLFILLPVLPLQAQSELRPFVTDYCTAYPEGTFRNRQLWRHCCLEHDLYLWVGGTRQDRLHTDLRLRSCVAATGEVLQSHLIYLGVRAGNYSPIKIPTKKWGHGWENRNPYAPLQSEEIDLIELKIHSGYESISLELKMNFINNLRSRLD